MRFIKDLMAWKQQAREEDEIELSPAVKSPEIGPLIPPRAQEDDEGEWEDEDDLAEEFEDEEEGFEYEYEEGEFEDEYEEEYEEEEEEDEPLPAPRHAPGPAVAQAAPVEPPKAPAPTAAEQSETYDLLSRVVLNSTPSEGVRKPQAEVRRAPPLEEPPPKMTSPVRPADPGIPDVAPPPVTSTTISQLAPKPPAEPKEQVAEAPAAAAKPAKIWDLNPGQAPERTPEVALPATPAPAAAQAAPAADAASGGRAKTRLLGFHNVAMDAADPFDAPASGPQSGGQFPTGWLVVVEGPGRGHSFTLGEGVNQIGRGEDQAIRLDFGDSSISRTNHALVAYDPETGKFFLGHGGKSNIVRLNGRPVLSTEEMASYDLIKIGETVLRFVGFCDEEFTWAEEPDSAQDAALG